MAQALPHIERKLPLSSSYAHFSDVSNHLLDESFVLGVDEAGRGPAMGPMVYGIAYVPVSKKDELSHTGVADSKTLSEAQRTNLYAIMVEKKWVCWAVNVCSPGDISGAMLQIEKCSLNVVAQRATVELIRGVLKRNIRIEEVFVDTLGHPDKHRAFLESQIPGVKFTVAKKADSLYPIVSAASIFAKVTRDALLQNWKFIEPSLDASASKEFGSGYPGDPATKKWLNDHIDPVFGFPSIIRFSWSTCERLLEKNAARITWYVANLWSYFARR
ncbi:ribonuclease HII [Cladochytrium replicatum]|nr:ribonuclease HII [Cladochytrium replicatum]